MRSHSLCRLTTSDGFTLIEVIVALFLMSIMALMAWKGVESMASSQQDNQAAAVQIVRTKAGLLQWKLDLDHIVALNNISAYSWTGSVFRLTRLDSANPAAGVIVVAWGLYAYQGKSYWFRWQSDPVTQLSSWQEAWERAGKFSSDNVQHVVTPVFPASKWNISQLRRGGWMTLGNGSAYQPRRNRPPDAIKLTLTIPENQLFSGEIRTTWLSPTYSSSSGLGSVWGGL